jgi:hypothetical protein
MRRSTDCPAAGAKLLDRERGSIKGTYPAISTGDT